MESALTSSEYRPVGQSMHADDPTYSLYFPAAHFSHARGDDAPWTSDDVPGGQSRHVDPATAPTSPEYLPAAQRMHAAVPATIV